VKKELTPEQHATEMKKGVLCKEASKVRTTEVKAVAARTEQAEIYQVL
jgi:hypothetical protein